MVPLAALLLLLAGAGQDQPPVDQGTVEQWITDLGSADEQRRERAETELKKLGRSAVPALREAARSDDAERAMRARALLVEMARAERGSPVPRMAVLYEDWSKGIRFALAPSGKVTLTVPEKVEDTGRREYKTYQADSIDEFKKKYPEIARKVELDKLLSFREIPMSDEHLRAWLGLRDEETHPSEEAEESGGRRFGIQARPVDPALAAQLRLRRGEGLVVRRVEPGSIAEKSGLKPFDVIVTVDGEKVSAQRFEEFRRRLQEAEFTLEVFRGGRQEKIHVKPTAEEKKLKAK